MLEELGDEGKLSGTSELGNIAKSMSRRVFSGSLRVIIVSSARFAEHAAFQKSTRPPRIDINATPGRRYAEELRVASRYHRNT